MARNPHPFGRFDLALGSEAATNIEDPRLLKWVKFLQQLETEALAAYESGDYDRADGLSAQYAELAERIENVAAEVTNDPGDDWQMVDDSPDELMRNLAARYADYLEGALATRYGEEQSEAGLLKILRGVTDSTFGPNATRLSDVDLIAAAKDSYEYLYRLRNRGRGRLDQSQQLKQKFGTSRARGGAA